MSSYPNAETRLVLSMLPSARISAPVLLSPEQDACERSEGVDCIPDFSDPLSLGLNSTKDTKKSTRTSQRSFTLAAKRKILRSAGALDRLDPAPAHKLFLTGTLPGGTPAALAAIALCAPKIVHLFRKWVAYKFPPIEHYFYCWELQKRGALHLHYCLYCPDANIRSEIIGTFRQWWHDALCKFSDELGVDMFERAGGGSWRGRPDKIRAEAQEVYSSVGSYIAKYCSKSAGKAFGDYCPPRWSSVSRPLGALLLKYTEEIYMDYDSYTDAASSFVSAREELTSPEALTYTYSHRVGAGRSHIAFYGKNIGDSQSCQYLSASQIVSSAKHRELYHLPIRTVSELFQFTEALPIQFSPSSPLKSPVSNPLPQVLTHSLPGILRVLHGVSPSTQQVLAARSAMMACWQLLTALSMNIPITPIQRTLLRLLSPIIRREERAGSLLKRFPPLSPLMKLCKDALTLEGCPDYRSTTNGANEHPVQEKEALTRGAVPGFYGTFPPLIPVEWEQLSFSG